MQKNKGTKILANQPGSHALAPLAIAIASITSQFVYAEDAGTEAQYKKQVTNGSVSVVNITQDIGLGLTAYQRTTGNALTLQSKTSGTQYQISAPAYDNGDESRALTLGIDAPSSLPSGPALTKLKDLKLHDFEFVGDGGAVFLGGRLSPMAWKTSPLKTMMPGG